MPMDEKLIFVAEVAKMANRSSQTIKKWAKDGKIPAPKKLKSSGKLVFTEPQAREIVKYSKETE